MLPNCAPIAGAVDQVTVDSFHAPFTCQISPPVTDPLDGTYSCNTALVTTAPAGSPLTENRIRLCITLVSFCTSKSGAVPKFVVGELLLTKASSEAVNDGAPSVTTFCLNVLDNGSGQPTSAVTRKILVNRNQEFTGK